MDMVCKIGHKSLSLKLSTNFVSVQDNPSETSVFSFQISTSSQLYVSISTCIVRIWKKQFRNLVFWVWLRSYKTIWKSIQYATITNFINSLSPIQSSPSFLTSSSMSQISRMPFTKFLSCRCAKSTSILLASQKSAQNTRKNAYNQHKNC